MHVCIAIVDFVKCCTYIERSMQRAKTRINDKMFVPDGMFVSVQLYVDAVHYFVFAC